MSRRGGGSDEEVERLTQQLQATKLGAGAVKVSAKNTKTAQQSRDRDSSDGKYKFRAWRRHFSKDPSRKGRPYYRNFETKQTSWIDPSTFTPQLLADHEAKMTRLKSDLEAVVQSVRAKTTILVEASQSTPTEKVSNSGEIFGKR